MSLAVPLAIYASVTAHLGEALEFPGDITQWTATQRSSSSMLDAYFEEWLVLTEGVENQRFNATDGTVWAWEMMWPRVADWYGIKASSPTEDNDAEWRTLKTAHEPPPRG